MRRRGFTLIELLVVIAIIAILAAILFPIFTSAKSRATQTKCLNNMKQLSMAVRQYCDDYNGTTPFNYPEGKGLYDWCGIETCGQRPKSVDPANGYDVVNGGLWKYVRSRGVYSCPTDLRRISLGDGYFKAYINESTYSMNCVLGSIRSANRYIKLDAATAGRASKIMLFLEEQANNDGYCVWNDPADFPSKRHYEGGNIVYVDGHAKYGSRTKLLDESKTGAWNRNP